MYILLNYKLSHCWHFYQYYAFRSTPIVNLLHKECQFPIKSPIPPCFSLCLWEVEWLFHCYTFKCNRTLQNGESKNISNQECQKLSIILLKPTFSDINPTIILTVFSIHYFHLLLTWKNMFQNAKKHLLCYNPTLKELIYSTLASSRNL